MFKLHQVVEDTNFPRLIDSVKEMALYHVLSVVPLLCLPSQLAPLEGIVHHLAVLSAAIVTVDLALAHSRMQPLGAVHVIWILLVLRVDLNQSALLESVWH